MLGRLPTSLTVDGTPYRIRTDYRDILRIIEAFQDGALTDAEKIYVCLKNIYTDFNALPESSFESAYKAAVEFIDYGIKEDTPSPKVLDWAHDESLLFPAINKVAGFEVRAAEYVHWWTFNGYFQGIDKEDTYGYVLMIRQKKAKHKKLEKWEQEFYHANRNMCDIGRTPGKRQNTPEDTLAAIYAELLNAQNGGAEDGTE